MDFERYEFTQPLYGGVNVLRVGDTLVDTGHVASVCRDAVADAVADDLAGVERVLLTHPHIDHVGGSQTIPGLSDLPHVVPAGVPDFLHDFDGYLGRAREGMTRLLAGFGAEEGQWDHYFPRSDDYAEDDIRVARVLTDGDVVSAGGYDLEVLSTPGHSAQHLAFWHEASGTLFSGDLVSENGHFQYGPLHGDVGDYKRSLERVRALDPDRLVPMHGAVWDDPAARIDDCLAKAEETEAKLLDWHDDRGEFYAREFTAEVLGAEGMALPFLTLVTYEYLAHLDERGLLSVEVTDEGIRVA